MAITVSVLNGGANGHSVSAPDFNAIATDFFSSGPLGALSNTAGVAPAGGAGAVNAQSSPNGTVQVSAGTHYITGVPTSSVAQNFRVVDTVGATVAIAANVSGSTLYDWIYLVLDAAKLKDPDVAGDDVASYLAVRSTLSTSNTGTTPSNSILLGVVTVVNPTTNITNANCSDRRVQAGVNALPLGAVLQIASTPYSAVATGTTILPWDDTVPQITEGTEFMTQVITPKSVTNRLSIEATLMVANTASSQLTAALFQDAIPGALAAMDSYQPTANGTVNLKLTHDMLAGTVAPITFRIRAGNDVAGITTFNGNSGLRRFGGITISSIKITEYKA